MHSFRLPSQTLLDALRRLDDVTNHSGTFGDILFVKRGDSGFAFFNLDASMPSNEIAAALLRLHGELPGDSAVFQYYACVGGYGRPSEPVHLGLGLKMVPIHDGVASLVGLPHIWRKHQLTGLGRALCSAIGEGDPTSQLDTLAELLIREDGEDNGADFPASKWLYAHLFDPNRPGCTPIYLRAEAGKGKSTVLAAACILALKAGDGPLPIFVPLRELTRAEGVSWENLTTRLGVLGTDAATLALAVRAGLVTLVLDGLDEVSGRYDPAVVKDVLSLVKNELGGQHARVAISGRTTESTLIGREGYTIASVELPLVGTPAFTSYVWRAIDRVAQTWARTFSRIPEPRLEVRGAITDCELRNDEREAIADWIDTVFESLGKDRSLFFIQSLVGVARTFQLDGNRPILIRDRRGAISHQAEPSIFEVCLLAASLACVREEEKIDSVAFSRFPVSKQLDALSTFALLASAGDTVRAQLPLPNALISEIFEIDAVQETEVFAAVVSQMQKHALLHSSGTAGTRSASWRPAFLSDWVRGALMVRAWESRARLPGALVPLIPSLVANAERAKVAFQYLVPHMDGSVLRELVDALRVEARTSPEAAGNLIVLLSALPDTDWAAELHGVSGLPQWTEVRGATIEGAQFSGLGNIQGCFFSDTEFVDCKVRDLTFDTCDLAGARFLGCEFAKVRFRHCDGPIQFVDCKFHDVEFVDISVSAGVALEFEYSDFNAGSGLIQNSPIAAGRGRLASFKACTFEAGTTETLITGDWHGMELSRTDELRLRDEARILPRETQTLRTTLRTFFPSRVGPGGHLQVRPYIRSSALGRGSLPAGAPSGADLFHILECVGFTNGGRQNHLYGPWSSVAGATESGIRLRNELNEFLSQGREGPTVLDLLDRIRRFAGW